MKITDLYNRARESRLARNTLWMMLGQGARVPIQGLYFILIARSLGAQGYGAFVGVTALVAILAPFGGLGSGNLLVKNVSRDETTFGQCWGKVLVVTLVSGALLVMVAALLSTVLLPPALPFALILSVSLADLILNRLLDAAGQAFQAFEKLSRTSQIMILPFLFRLILLAGLVVYVPKPSPTLWGYFYLASLVVSTLIAVLLVHRELGPPLFDGGLFSEVKEGFYFSISLSSQNIYNDIDKTLLTRLGTLQAAGVYGAAYRIIDVSFTPIRSLLYASYARFFRQGSGGVRVALGFAKKLLPYAIGYGAITSLALFLSAPLVPLVLGSEFHEIQNALVWLSPLPFLKVFHYFAADSLSGSGFQGLRSLCQIGTAVVNVMLIIWLIPTYSWKGAAWASLATDAFLVVTLWFVILVLSRKDTARYSPVEADCLGQRAE